MIILGIETSSIVCSVGIHRAQTSGCERSIVDPHIHSEKLLTLVNEVLGCEGLQPKHLDAVAVSIGPGSFTGLRIGLSTAKGLCYALNKNLICIPTFDAVDYAVREMDANVMLVIIALDAKQGEYYLARYAQSTRGEYGRSDVRACRLEELDWTAELKDSTTWVTDRKEELTKRGVAEANVFEFSSLCKGSVIARLGMLKFDKGEFSDLSSVEPMYLKEFVAKIALT